MRTNIISTKNINSSRRFDPSYHLSDAIILRDELESVPFEKVSISKVTDKVFLGNIFSPLIPQHYNLTLFISS